MTIKYVQRGFSPADFASERGYGLVKTNACLREKCRVGDEYPELQAITQYNRTCMACPKCHARYGEVIERDRPTIGKTNAPYARLRMAQRLMWMDEPAMHLSFEKLGPDGKINIAIGEDDARRLRDALIRQYGHP